jgi:GrpB-like predicted nucleotidyltransferase (UPF0157 family)
MGAEETIVLVPYDLRWPAEFREIGRALRAALGPTAARIDHVGSTSVATLDAKPVIDIQLSVLSLVPDAPYRPPIEALGFEFRPENPDRSKRFFRRPPRSRGIHVHVRLVGSFEEQLNLLFRDYLRAHEAARQEYAKAKWELAARFRNDREGYVRAKEPVVWSLLTRAHDWLQATGWSPGPSDA